MKRLVETEGQGLEAFLGEKVVIFCLVYIYIGTLTGVNEHTIELADPAIAYETGELDSGEWLYAEPLLSPHYVRTSAIESWGKAKC